MLASAIAYDIAGSVVCRCQSAEQRTDSSVGLHCLLCLRQGLFVTLSGVC